MEDFKHNYYKEGIKTLLIGVFIVIIGGLLILYVSKPNGDNRLRKELNNPKYRSDTPEYYKRHLREKIIK